MSWSITRAVTWIGETVIAVGNRFMLSQGLIVGGFVLVFGAISTLLNWGIRRFLASLPTMLPPSLSVPSASGSVFTPFMQMMACFVPFDALVLSVRTYVAFWAALTMYKAVRSWIWLPKTI